MGMYSEKLIARAGAHLLEVLAANQSVVYGEYVYDGTDTTAERVAGIVQAPGECAELAFDLAASQLKDAGWVTLEDTGSMMSDDNLDYRIELTETGSRALEQGRHFQFSSVML